jgi:hypothetical protein
MTVDRYKRCTDTVSALGTIVAIVGLVVAYNIYKGHREEANNQRESVERIALLERTAALLVSPADTERAENHRKAMLTQFRGRWKPKMTDLISPDEARKLWDASADPSHRSHGKWDAARRHLNGLEPIAFAYVHGLADKEILARSHCKYLTRSALYFGELIERFRIEYGVGHTWQVIAHAATAMRKAHGNDCEEFSAKQQVKPKV